MYIIMSDGVGSIEDILVECGNKAGICYGGVESVCVNDRDSALKRANFCLKNGHHSIFEHKVVSMVIEGIPKVLSMYLNSMGMYSTTERSGRYTLFDTEGNGEYSKWYTRLTNYLNDKHSGLGKQICTIARENARYMLSVFTETDMVYTINIRQLNYLFGYMEAYISDMSKDSLFDIKLKACFKEFIYKLSFVNIDGLRDWKRDDISSLKGHSYTDGKVTSLNDVYEADYKGTYVYLAQAQRHRTINYRYIETNEYYVPDIIKEMGCEDEWLRDISNVSYAQGTLLNIKEYGSIEHLKLKVDERLCGDAQYEIMGITKWIVRELSDKDIFSKYIKQGEVVARCVAGYRCKNICVFGGKNGVSRKM